MSEPHDVEQTPAIPFFDGPLPTMSDDETLTFTRGVRIKVVQSLFSAGAVSGENSDRILLTNMLNGLDTQAVNSKKIQADAKAGDNAAVIVAELLRTIDKRTLFQGAQGAPVVDVESRMLPNNIPETVMLPGEMSVAPPQMDYNSFVQSQGKDVDQIGKNVKHAETVEDDGTP